MQDTDFDRDTGRPVGLILLVGALAVIGAFTVVGWVAGMAFFVVKLALLALVIFAVVTAVRVIARR